MAYIPTVRTYWFHCSIILVLVFLLLFLPFSSFSSSSPPPPYLILLLLFLPLLLFLFLLQTNMSQDISSFFRFRNFIGLLWFSGQSSWLQSWRPRVRFPGTTRKKIVGLEWGPLSLVSTTEGLLGRNSSGFGLESPEYGRWDSSRWPRGILYTPKSWH
jgi:hypothetical protein